MSEYQYYEFQAVDRPLTAQEQAEIQKLSSRVQLSPTQAIFVYNYGDFRAQPEKILTQYFDAMFYIANWGTWQFLFRLPLAMVDVAQFQPYCIENAISVSTTRDHFIVNITIHEENGINGWVEGSGWLPRLLPLRDDLISGDLRLLYLAWLRVAPDAAGDALDDDPVEPPIPANLDDLSHPLKTFIELVELDDALVIAAAQASRSVKSTGTLPLENWIPQLSEAERQDFLLKLVRREPNVDLQLIHRLKELARADLPAAPSPLTGQRRWSELVAIAADLEHQRKQAAKADAQKKRQQYLKTLAPKAPQTWDRIHDLIALKQAKAYDEAAMLCQDLHDLAEVQGKLPEFNQRLKTLKNKCSNRPAFLQRLSQKKL